jgi:flagellar basal-body rod modification protein FlgD
MGIIANVANTIASANAGTSNTSGATSSSGASTSATAQAAGSSASQQLAGNFDTFLQLLTTQLQNQDPLDPLDTDQFTQQLVEFSSVEQQINTNTNLQTMISLQQATEATSALQLVGSTVTVGGNSATLSNATNSPASWSLTAPSAATANVTITNAAGQTAYAGTVSLSAGSQNYSWNGQGNNGTTWPDGTYTLTVKATNAAGQAVTVSTQMQGTVTGVNLAQSPPLLTVNGQNVQISQIQSITAGGSGSLSSLNSSISSLNSSISNLSSIL